MYYDMFMSTDPEFCKCTCSSYDTFNKLATLSQGKERVQCVMSTMCTGMCPMAWSVRSSHISSVRSTEQMAQLCSWRDWKYGHTSPEADHIQLYNQWAGLVPNSFILQWVVVVVVCYGMVVVWWYIHNVHVYDVCDGVQTRELLITFIILVL